MPFRSEPEDAAVGVVLGTMSVFVAVILTLLEVDAELLRHHLRNLGVEPLPHLGAAVVHKHGAVGIDMHERARLVEVLQGEGDPELDGRERQPLLEKPRCPR